MLRLFGWVVAGGILLGSVADAHAQVSQTVANPANGTGATPGTAGAGYGYPGFNAYANPSGQLPGAPAYPGGPPAGTAYGPVDGGYAGPGTAMLDGCFTLYPLTTTYPYSYTGPGTGFGAYKYVPYPYAPYGYGWYGTHWRGW